MGWPHQNTRFLKVFLYFLYFHICCPAQSTTLWFQALRASSKPLRVITGIGKCGCPACPERHPAELFLLGIQRWRLKKVNQRNIVTYSSYDFISKLRLLFQIVEVSFHSLNSQLHVSPTWQLASGTVMVRRKWSKRSYLFARSFGFLSGSAATVGMFEAPKHHPKCRLTGGILYVML